MIGRISKWLKSNESGFTLIELMVVVVILGILAAIVIPQFSNSTDKAREARAKAELKSMQNAIEIYYMENGNQYPSSIGAALNENGITTWPQADPWGNNYGWDNSGHYFYSQGPDTDVSSDDIKSNNL